MNKRNVREPVTITVSPSGEQHISHGDANRDEFHQSRSQRQSVAGKIWQRCQHGVAKVMTLSLVVMLWLMSMMLITVSGLIALGAALWQGMKLSKSSRNQSDPRASL